MDQEQVLFSLSLKKLEPIFKRWFKEALADLIQSNNQSILTEEQTSVKFNISKVTLHKWRRAKFLTEGKSYFYLGKSIRYREEQFIEEASKINSKALRA